MEPHEAIAQAKKYVQELFDQESISNLGFEEIEFEENTDTWHITLGFSRPWEIPMNSLAALARQMQAPRDYKVVRISDKTGRLVSVKNRESTNES